MPILLYGCEVWGFTNTNMIDIVHNQFLRSISKLRKSTPVYMLYAELGRIPIEVCIKSRMIGYWISLINGNEAKYCRKLYDIMLAEHNRGKTYKWLSYIKSILISVGMPDLLNQNYINNPQATKAKISKTLYNLFVQEWHTKLTLSSKGRNYSYFKSDLSFVSYLITLSKNSYIPMIKFRTENYKLLVETGRWQNIPLDERKCNLCDRNDLGDDFHYMFVCPHFRKERSKLLKSYYYTRPNMIKYKDLLHCNNKKVLINLSKFMKLIMNKFSN